MWVARAGDRFALLAPRHLLPCWVVVDDWLGEAITG
jgi:hypothetical protein